MQIMALDVRLVVILLIHRVILYYADIHVYNIIIL